METKVENNSDNANKRLENFLLLKQYSDAAQVYCEEQGVIFERVNQALAYFYKSRNFGTEFKKFRQWVQEGKKIRKGAKGKLFWTRPLKELNLEKEASKRELNDDEINRLLLGKSDYSFCYLFSEYDLV